MKRLRLPLAIVSAIFVCTSFVSAQTSVTTDPVGYVTGTCKANSDTIVSVPLAHAPEYVGTISAAPTIVSGSATVLASGTSPSWTLNQFAALYSNTVSYPTYYIKFKSGVLNGRNYTVTTNGANSVTFDTGGDDVSGAATGDQFALIKYWTLGDLFPAATQTTFVVSASTLALHRKSLLLLPDLSGTGINLAPNQLFFVTSAGWQKVATGFPDASNQILYPDTFFIVRHPSSVTTDTTFTMMGSVNTDRVVTSLSTLSTGKQDNFVAIQRPVGVSLAQSGISTGFVPSANTLALNRRDVLYVYDNEAIAKNKAPSRVFFMVGSSWVEAASGFPSADSFVLEPGTGVIIRKYQTAGGTSSSWVNDPNF